MSFPVAGFCCGQSSIQFKCPQKGYIFTSQVKGLYTLIWQCCTVCLLRVDSCFSIIMHWSSHFRCNGGSLHLHPTKHMLLHSFQFIYPVFYQYERRHTMWISILVTFMPWNNVAPISGVCLKTVTAVLYGSTRFPTIEDPEFWSDLWVSLLSDVLCSVHLQYCTFCKEKITLIMLRILGATTKFGHPGDQVPRIWEFVLFCPMHVLETTTSSQ